MDSMFHFFLLFSQWWLALTIALIGFALGKRWLCYHATCLVLFSMLVNVALKSTFQIPLSPSLNVSGFAFPSGHMQFATVFYGWLALQTKHRSLQALAIGILTGVGASLVHFGYHSWFDVFGALFFGGILIVCYQKLIAQKEKYVFWSLALSAILLLSYIAYRVPIPNHALMAFVLLMSLLSGRYLMFV